MRKQANEKMNEEKRPLLATGKLGANYKLLYAYWEIAKKHSHDKAAEIVLKTEDFNEVEKILKKTKENKRVFEIIEEVLPRFIKRIDPAIAVEAYEQVYSTKINPSDAVRELAKIMAIWLIEALETEGKIVFK